MCIEFCTNVACFLYSGDRLWPQVGAAGSHLHQCLVGEGHFFTPRRERPQHPRLLPRQCQWPLAVTVAAPQVPLSSSPDAPAALLRSGGRNKVPEAEPLMQQERALLPFRRLEVQGQGGRMTRLESALCSSWLEGGAFPLRPQGVGGEWRGLGHLSLRLRSRPSGPYLSRLCLTFTASSQALSPSTVTGEFGFLPADWEAQFRAWSTARKTLHRPHPVMPALCAISTGCRAPARAGGSLGSVSLCTVGLLLWKQARFFGRPLSHSRLRRTLLLGLPRRTLPSNGAHRMTR